PNDIHVVSATTNGLTTLTMTYEISGIVSPFFVGFYRSANSSFDGSDAALGSVAVSVWSDLTPGLHTKSWTIGSAAGQVPLPGAGSTEVDTDYYLLAVADPTNVISETDGTSPGANNIVALT